MTKDPLEAGAAFAAEMKACWGADLAAVVLYGSAARDDYVPGRSDLNFLVLVRDLDPVRLLGLGKLAKAWRKRKIAMPVFMRPEMVATALDSYPLEFLTMKAAYRLLHGEDPLASLTFSPEDVRLQCERDLRGKLLHLRAGAIASEGKRDRRADLIRASLPALTAIFQGLLFIAGRDYALWGGDLLEAGHAAFDLDADLFHALARLRFEKRLPPREELEQLLVRYLIEVERLVTWADSGGLKVKSES